MSLAGDVVRVADEEIDVADDGRLVGEIADVGRRVVRRCASARELDRALGPCRQPLDESFELFARNRLGRDGAAVRERDVVERAS